MENEEDRKFEFLKFPSVHTGDLKNSNCEIRKTVQGWMVMPYSFKEFKGNLFDTHTHTCTSTHAHCFIGTDVKMRTILFT